MNCRKGELFQCRVLVGLISYDPRCLRYSLASLLCSCPLQWFYPLPSCQLGLYQCLCSAPHLSTFSRHSVSPRWLVLSHKVICFCDLSLWHVSATKSNKQHTMWLDTMACCCNELPVKIVSQGRPTIGLFTVVTGTCCTGTSHEGTECVCCCYLLHEFKLIGTRATSCSVKKHTCHTRWPVPRTCCGEKLPRVTGPQRTSNGKKRYQISYQ